MDGGLTIYNDSGTVQIDSTYRNLTHVRTRNIYPGISQTITPPSSAARMSAIYSETGVICAPAYGPNKFDIAGSGQFFDFEDADITPSHYGLNVYRGDGSICYSSDSKPLRVLYQQSGVLSGIDDQVLYSNNIAFGRKVAVVIGQQPIIMIGDKSSRPYHVRWKGLRVVTSTNGYVEVRFTEYRNVVQNVDNSRGDNHYNFAIVDITGY